MRAALAILVLCAALIWATEAKHRAKRLLPPVYSSTSFVVGQTPITCDTSAPQWAVLTVSPGHVPGAGLYWDASTATFSVDADTAYISVNGDVDLEMYISDNTYVYGDKWVTGSLRFEVLDATTSSVLVTLAHEVGASYSLDHEPSRIIHVPKLVVPQGHSFGSIYKADACFWYNLSPTVNLVINVHKPRTKSPATLLRLQPTM